MPVTRDGHRLEFIGSARDRLEPVPKLSARLEPVRKLSARLEPVPKISVRLEPVPKISARLVIDSEKGRVELNRADFSRVLGIKCCTILQKCQKRASFCMVFVKLLVAARVDSKRSEPVPKISTRLVIGSEPSRVDFSRLGWVDCSLYKYIYKALNLCYLLPHDRTKYINLGPLLFCKKMWTENLNLRSE